MDKGLFPVPLPLYIKNKKKSMKYCLGIAEISFHVLPLLIKKDHRQLALPPTSVYIAIVS